ncbi:hypothetical protein [Sporosarcina sp. HYO08]|uniref:hypothetical protein n=1 Tax=Sporosarcina sp. HYO08 TaxID=1759557 RepID=UPI0007987C06|nr:hypothetical protein [Sporosarcina sp. HYO08]KXH83728.1 hypothetical protein AU377_14820 [Sporosarcina sp. HYO08]
MLPDNMNKTVDSLAQIVGNLDEYSKKLLGIKEDTVGSAIFDFVYEAGAGAAPVVSNIIQSIQIRNLKNGLKEVNNIVQDMSVTLKEHEEKFIQEKALPLIFKNVVQEEQEEKIKIMINGFESIVYDSMYDEDNLYEYYDVLKSLRKKELARMLQLYNKEIRNQETYNIGNFKFDGTSIEYIDNKLVQLGLRRTFIIDEGTWGALASPEEDTAFTEFGKRFIKFFRNRKFNE